MLTKLIVRKFKRFEDAEIELGNPVVFIGPNNSGKTSALQALALWDVGLKRWSEKRKSKTVSKRPGVTVNRRDLIAIPVPNANLLWRDLHVRDVRRRGPTAVETKNIRIDIVVEGITEDVAWRCGFEFDYANEESFYCRPLRLSEDKDPERMEIPDKAETVRIAYLPPMSGLASTEDRLDPGSVNVRIGEGRTAEVLRNLCYKISENDSSQWKKLTRHIETLFGVDLDMPVYIAERGEIVMTYKERGTKLDLSSSGRGLQQTLLLLSYMFANPGAVLLLDEPDAHLEILRQRQIYQLLTDVADRTGSQIIAASHSEVLLNEAADRDVVVAFLGRKPHRIDDRGNQLLKSLKEIGYEHYYQAEQTGWVLYLEGSTDLQILRIFAERLGMEEARKALARPFVHYVGNQPQQANKHFWALKEAVPTLKGLAIFDRDAVLTESPEPRALVWRRREIENYFCYRETLEAYARAISDRTVPGPLFAAADQEARVAAMSKAIDEVSSAMETLQKGSPWDVNTKVSDDFLDPLFRNYFKKLGLYNLMAKKNFYELASYVPEDKIDREIVEKLETIASVAGQAHPEGVDAE